MASIISHVIYADQYLKQNPGMKNSQGFLLGVLFPDIRRVSNVTRTQTHNGFKKLDLHFERMTAFEAGWKFHVWCDMRRNEIVRDEGFFNIIKKYNYHYFSCYFLEDQLIWNKYRNWETLSVYLKNAPFLDLFDELDESDWNFWYGIIADFVSDCPDQEAFKKILKKIPSLAGKAEKILNEIENAKKNKKIVSFLESLYLNII